MKRWRTDWGCDLEKPILGDLGQEALTCVRHCNLVDFWLLTYDQLEGRYWLGW